MAAIGLALGILVFSVGLLMAIAGVGADVTVEVRKMVGQFIDHGIFSVLGSVVIGVLSEISQSLSGNETINR
jgi:hypothetical protein